MESSPSSNGRFLTVSQQEEPQFCPKHLDPRNRLLKWFSNDTSHVFFGCIVLLSCQLVETFLTANPNAWALGIDIFSWKALADASRIGVCVWEHFVQRSKLLCIQGSEISVLLHGKILARFSKQRKIFVMLSTINLLEPTKSNFLKANCKAAGNGHPQGEPRYVFLLHSSKICFLFFYFFHLTILYTYFFNYYIILSRS